MSNIIIKLNNQEIFQNQQNPYISASTDFIRNENTNFGIIENWSLQGVLTGFSFNEIEKEKIELTNIFSENIYASFEVLENGNTKIKLDQIEVQSISFNDSDYINILPYEISFIYYKSKDNNKSLVQRSNSISFSENEDGTVSIQRDISAKGFVSGQDRYSAINSARNFIEEKRSESIPNSIFFNQKSQYNFNNSEFSFNEEILKGEKSLSEKYVISKQSGVLTSDYINLFQESYSSGISEPISYSIEGNIFGPISGDINKCEQILEEFLKTQPHVLMDFSKTIDSVETKISYSATYEQRSISIEDPLKIIDDYTISVEENVFAEEAVATVNGEIYLNKSEQYESLENYIINFHGDEMPTIPIISEKKLQSTPKEYSKKYLKNENKWEYSAVFTNQDLYESGVQDVSITINKNYSSPFLNIIYDANGNAMAIVNNGKNIASYNYNISRQVENTGFFVTKEALIGLLDIKNFSDDYLIEYSEDENNSIQELNASVDVLESPFVIADCGSTVLL